jgi:hypothetical protein
MNVPKTDVYGKLLTHLRKRVYTWFNASRQLLLSSPFAAPLLLCLSRAAIKSASIPKRAPALL